MKNLSFILFVCFVILSGCQLSVNDGAVVQKGSHSELADNSVPQTTWAVETPLPLTRTLNGAVAFQSKVYVFGGQDVNNNFISTVEVYDPATKTWSTKAPMPVVFNKPKAVVVGSLIYVFCGDIASDNSNNEGTVKVFTFDPNANTWSQITTLPVDTNSYNFDALSVAAVNGIIYVAGFLNPEDFLGNCSDFYSFNTVNRVWTKESSLPVAMRDYSIQSLGNKVYLAGGRMMNGKFGTIIESQKTYVYDPSNKAWSAGPDMNTSHYNFSTVAVNNSLYALGGNTNLIESFDPLQNKWSSVYTLPNNFQPYGTCALNNAIYLAGGYTPDNFSILNSVYSLVVNNSSSSQSSIASSGSSAMNSSSKSSSASSSSSSSSGVVYTTITAPFTFNGAGTYHWKIAVVPSYINDWNLSALAINGTSFLNLYVAASQLPAQKGGYYYIDYTGPYSWSHLEIK